MRTTEDINNEIEALEEQISDKQEEINNFDKAEHLSDERYAEMLDDCYGEVNICGMTFFSSVAFRELDPIAYRCGFNDFADSMDNDEFEEYTELQEELEELENELNELNEELEELNEETTK
jgi:DNA repair exonuclease SbcCD ATPase subunit